MVTNNIRHASQEQESYACCRTNFPYICPYGLLFCSESCIDLHKIRPLSELYLGLWDVRTASLHRFRYKSRRGQFQELSAWKKRFQLEAPLMSTHLVIILPAKKTKNVPPFVSIE